MVQVAESDAEQDFSVQIEESLSAGYELNSNHDGDSNCGEEDGAHSDIDHGDSIT